MNLDAQSTSTSAGVQVSTQDGIGRLMLDLPPRNLLTPDVMQVLGDALRELDARDDTKVIVLTGSGGAFCGGLDTDKIKAGADPVQFARALGELLKIFPRLGVPIVAAVNGDALASGFSLVCASDIAIAVSDARLGTVEASLGIWPMVAQVPLLLRLPPRAALQNLLTGVPFDAATALTLGALNEVVAPGELEDAAARWAQSITGAGAALAAGRQAFYRLLGRPWDDALDEAVDEFASMFDR